MKNVNQLAKDENWNDFKKVRAQIAVFSMQKSAQRVIRQKEEDKIDSLEKEEQFNLALSKEISY